MKTNSRKYSNVGYIKFLAAMLVIISHAFPLSTGEFKGEVLVILSKNQITMGSFAVCIFFFYSGFFISKSLHKDNRLNHFFRKRVVRIFPILFLTIFISTLIMGPIVSTLSFKEYLTCKETYLYFMNAFLIPYHILPGVFEKNIYGSVVNGSLWTLPVEFACYLYSYILVKLRMNKELNVKKIIILCFASLIVKDILNHAGHDNILFSMILPFTMYNMGIYYQIRNENKKYNWNRLFVNCFLIIISNLLGILQYGLIIALPYVLVYFGMEIKEIKYEFIIKDISYYIYLCAFPIQQIIVCLYGGKMNPYTNICIAIPISIVIGIAMYYVEKYMFEVVKTKEII